MIAAPIQSTYTKTNYAKPAYVQSARVAPNVATPANGHQTAVEVRERRHRALLSRLRFLCAKHYPELQAARRHECKTTIDQISVLSTCLGALAFGGDPHGAEIRHVLALVQQSPREWDLSDRAAWRLERNIRLLLRLAWRA